MSGNLKYVKNFQIMRPENEPGLVAIRANGIAEINHLYSPVLVPKKYLEAPDDGILELDFFLLPADHSQSNVEMEVDIVFKLKNLPPWVKGLKIIASENSDIELI